MSELRAGDEKFTNVGRFPEMSHSGLPEGPFETHFGVPKGRVEFSERFFARRGSPPWPLPSNAGRCVDEKANSTVTSNATSNANSDLDSKSSSSSNSSSNVNLSPGLKQELELHFRHAPELQA